MSFLVETNLHFRHQSQCSRLYYEVEFTKNQEKASDKVRRFLTSMTKIKNIYLLRYLGLSILAKR